MAEETNEEETAEESPMKKSKKPLLIGLVLALLGGGGGFYATWSGLLLGGESEKSEKAETMGSNALEKTDVAYVEVNPITVSLPPTSRSKHLLFRASLEVAPAAKSEVEKLLPRVLDVLNGYLRALDPSELEDPSTLTRLRAQMLRRIQVVTGVDQVNDLLIMEFVLN